MDNQKKAYLFALATVLIWSTVASAFKISLRYLPPAHLLLYAALVSTLLLGGILTVQGRMGGVFRIAPADYLRSLGMGLLNPFLYYLVLFQAFNLLPAQEAQPLNYTWAITLSILAIPLLGQKLSVPQALAILVSYSGVLVISTRGEPLSLSFSDPAGVALALGSTMIWALYWICNTRDHRPALEGLFLNFLCSFPFILAYCLLFTDMALPEPAGLLGAAYVGCFEMGISFVLWLQALKHTSSAAKISTLIFISPFLSLVFIHFLVGETILPSTYVGLVLIVTGLALQQLKRSRPA